MTIDAYCLKCKTTRTITAADEHVNARGTRMAQGPCPVCGTKVTTFLPKAEAAPPATPTARKPAAMGATASKAPTKGKTTTTSAASATPERTKRRAKQGA